MIMGAEKPPMADWYSGWSVWLVWSEVRTKIVFLNHGCFEAEAKKRPMAWSV